MLLPVFDCGFSGGLVQTLSLIRIEVNGLRIGTEIMSVAVNAYRLVVVFGLVALVTGCGSKVQTIKVDPAVAGPAAVKLYDKNGDGLLDETELKACPALMRELGAYDKSRDKKLSAEEIAEQIGSMYGHSAGLVKLSCTVTLDGAPLSGATVKFIPEPFLGEGIKTAEGVVDAQGSAVLGIPKEDLPKQLQRHSFMRVGIYRVEISHATRKIPAKYNTETELGYEFHKLDHIVNPVYNLTSK